MSYFTLDEAAQYATNKKGFKVEPSELLRSGVHGYLILCAPFEHGVMMNSKTGFEDDFNAALLVLPPSHLFEIESNGKATIKLAYSLDANVVYIPYRERTRDQLRVMRAHLDKFLPMLIDTTEQTDAKPGAVTTIKLRRNTLDPAIDRAIKQAGNMELADVYLRLKDLALDSVSPFTGALEGDALCYTNDNNSPEKLTKEALGKRLKNRR